MKIKFKPFRIQVDNKDYHVENGMIFPPRVLNLKKVLLVLAIIIGLVIALTSCSTVGKCTLKHVDPSEYQMIVTDDSAIIYDGKRFVGTIKLNGSLDSLIIEDNL
jgi:hypothetical protein